MVEPLTKSVFLNEEVERRYLGDEITTAGVRQSASERLEKAYAAVLESLDARIKSDRGEAIFRFHYKEPPLKDLVYADHPPSNAIRMELASIFAEIN